MITAGNGSIPDTPSAAVQQWSKLPYELLNAIYFRIDAPVTRARFAAVCMRWRAAASHPWMRVPPWLILDPCVSGNETRQYLYCPQDGTVKPRLPFLPEAAGGSGFLGGHEGGWIASSQAPFRIINVFSGAEVPLSGGHIIHGFQQQTCHKLVLRKLIFSEQPTSSSCILAGITEKHELAFYMVGFPESGWMVRGFYGRDGLMDIAFCNGELYGITRCSRGLLKYEFGVDNHGVPVPVDVYWLCTLDNYWENPDEHARYIVELRGKLLMVGSNNKWWSRCLRSVCASRFTVHELVKEMDRRNLTKYKWVEVDSLGEYALFLGPTCSKAVRVPAGGCGDLQRNHIYFSHHRCLKQKYEIPNGAMVFSTRSSYDDRVYYREEESDNGGVEGIMSVGYYVMGGVRPPMWLFPLDI